MEKYSSIIMIVILFVIFYFLLIRPERKRKQAAQLMRDNLQVGDTITTIGGVVGKVVSISNDFIVIETSEDRVRVEVMKWAVSSQKPDRAEIPEKISAAGHSASP